MAQGVIARLAERVAGRSAQGATVVRFAVVGVTATIAYLACSLALLRLGVIPQLSNALAFGASLAVSYAGHYFFTFRSQDPHLRTGTRFGLVTVVLLLLCSAVHQALLWSGVTSEQAAVAVAVIYPPLSFMLNHFWAFSRRSEGAKL